MKPDTLTYISFVAAAVIIVLAERCYALRNEKRLLREGAREYARSLYWIMLPAYSAIFPLSVMEVLVLRRHPPVWWLVAMTGLFFAAKLLKLWAVLQLRRNWTMKVIVPVEFQVVTSGPYRYIRHPNYLVVLIEVVALPLAGGAWITALVGGLAFHCLLRVRVRAEEAALFEHADYAVAMADKNRYLPRGRRR